MKKFLCALMTLTLLISGLALAEAGGPDAAVIDRFTDTWVDDYIAVEIWFEEEDGAFHCSAVKGDGGDESEVWAYGTCAYDAESDSLVCADGVRTRETYDEAADTPKSEVLAEGRAVTWAEPLPAAGKLKYSYQAYSYRYSPPSMPQGQTEWRTHIVIHVTAAK